MTSEVRIKFNSQTFEQILKSGPILAFVQAKASAIAAACNEQSSWGGYSSAAAIHSDRARATVWSYDDRNDEVRDNRMIRNLDA